MDQIRIDPTNVFASAVGEGRGIGRRELDALAVRRCRDLARVSSPDVEARRAARVDPILDYVASAQGRFRAVVVLAAHEEARLVRAVQTALVSPYADLAAAAMLPRLVVLDETDPDVLGEFLDAFDASECLFVVAAHDGDAPEAAAAFRIVRDVVSRKLGDEGHTDHVVFACAPSSGELREAAARHHYLTFDDGPASREDALSSVVLLPAALLGVDVKGLLFGAAAMAERCRADDWEANPALLTSCVHDLLAATRRERRSMACAYGHRLRDLAEWSSPASPRPSGLEARLAAGDDAWVTLLAVDRADHTLELAGGSFGTLNELFAGERESIRVQLARRGWPNMTVHFPSVTAHGVGQFLELVQVSRALRGPVAP